MKKSVKVLLRILLNLVLVTVLIMLGFWTGSMRKTEKHKIDLTQFSGRIIPSANIRLGTFTIMIRVPMSEALKYGKDAILSYGESGVEIWRPDNSTSGVFFYSAIITDNDRIKVYKISRTDKQILLHSHTPIFNYFAAAFFLLVATAVNIGAFIFTIKELKS